MTSAELRAGLLADRPAAVAEGLHQLAKAWEVGRALHLGNSPTVTLGTAIACSDLFRVLAMPELADLTGPQVLELLERAWSLMEPGVRP